MTEEVFSFVAGPSTEVRESRFGGHDKPEPPWITLKCPVRDCVFALGTASSHGAETLLDRYEVHWKDAHIRADH